MYQIILKSLSNNTKRIFKSWGTWHRLCSLELATTFPTKPGLQMPGGKNLAFLTSVNSGEPSSPLILEAWFILQGDSEVFPSPISRQQSYFKKQESIC